MREAWTIYRSNLGAINELTACTYLMAKGYYVFRGESPHAPFDLVAYKEGKCYRVEVKTVTAGKWLNIGTPANDEWDILIGVDFKNNMVFEFEQGTSRKQMIAEMRAAYGMSPSIRS